MNKWLVMLLSLLLALGAVGVGCGSDDDDDGDSAETAEEPVATSPRTETDTGGAAAPGRPVPVGMKDIQYVPKEVTVKAGGTVKWTNSDSVTHTVTKEGGPGAKFDSGNLDVGATFSQKFDTPGTVKYVCTIHPNQTGSVTVE